MNRPGGWGKRYRFEWKTLNHLGLSGLNALKERSPKVQSMNFNLQLTIHLIYLCRNGN